MGTPWQTRPLHTDEARKLNSTHLSISGSRSEAKAAEHLVECLLEETPEATVLHASGELDLSTLERLRVVAADAFAESRPLIVNLSG